MTEQLRDGYERVRKTIEPTLITVRSMTLDEIKALGYGDHVDFKANDGTLRRIKINGEVKRWKRDADRVRVSVKYGMYETGQLDAAEAQKIFRVRI